MAITRLVSIGWDCISVWPELPPAERAYEPRVARLEEWPARFSRRRSRYPLGGKQTACTPAKGRNPRSRNPPMLLSTTAAPPAAGTCNPRQRAQGRSERSEKQFCIAWHQPRERLLFRASPPQPALRLPLPSQSLTSPGSDRPRRAVCRHHWAWSQTRGRLIPAHYPPGVGWPVNLPDQSLRR
jgi:hypothetical protein